MFSRTVVILSTILFSVGILLISVLRSASINYAFSGKAIAKDSVQASPSGTPIEINYILPYSGRILPDSPLWPAKALRDKLWLLVTTNSTKKAEIRLLLADKRLDMAQTLFERNKPDLGFAVLTKAEKYLEEAVLLEEKNRGKGTDTSLFLSKLANASLKHRQVLGEIIEVAPEDARPKVVAIENYATSAFISARDGLRARGLPVPNNPFTGE